ncbi:MAG: alanine racemase [Rhodovarius sp.]|nr:alanine racemase [Rhodovarius sp.]
MTSPPSSAAACALAAPAAEEGALLCIDLAAIVANWRDLCARHGGAVAAVVKADAYGLGAEAVARALAAAGCRHFFVALLEEGLALRRALGEGPMIAVLNGFSPGHGPGLLPVVNTPAMAAAWSGRGPVLLHVDTGMERLGLPMAALDQLPPLEIAFVMTHLACAEEPAHPMNARQRERFAALRARFPGVPGSLANSSGIFLGPGFASDLARPGAALYGINPTPGRPNPMRCAVRLLAPILQLRQVAAGTPVGYGARWIAPRESVIALVAAGYADGYLRAAAGRAVGVLAGQPVPVVGRISMDVTAFDVTGLPAAEGEPIELIGPANPPDALAEAAGTIAYEVLVRLSRRCRRRYL